MPARVIVHAGYHKTGTSSLQDFFADNRAALAPYLTYYGKADFFEAGAAARIYAQKPFPWRLAAFSRRLRIFLASIADADRIVLSRETFSGGMPGHRKWSGAPLRSYFPPSRRLAPVIVDELRRRFGADCEITFFYTTRERAAWMASVHGHLLRSIRLTEDLAAFRARFRDIASPEEEALRMRAFLAPIPVVSAALEDHGARPEGPAAALLDLLDLPADLRQTLAPARRSNRGEGRDLRAAFLKLNRAGLGPDELRAAKARLLRTGLQEPASEA